MNNTQTIVFTTLWAVSADDRLVIFVLFPSPHPHPTNTPPTHPPKKNIALTPDVLQGDSVKTSDFMLSTLGKFSADDILK